MSNDISQAINVYRLSLFGRRRLVGWVDINGKTFRSSGPLRTKQVHWSIDSLGRVYLTFEGLEGFIGRARGSGSVIAQFGQPYGTYGTGSPGSPRFKRGFLPAVAFQVKPDGTVLGKSLLGTRPVGQIEGTTDPHTMGALALVLLL